MLSILTSIIGILLTILFVVGIHELGHFLVARWVGVKVLRFSIGFGKPLYSRYDKKGTEYVIAAIPLGGYIKMLDEEDGFVPPNEAHAAFNRQPFYKKIAVIAAGPLFNLLFAFVIYWILFVTGFVTIAPVIGRIVPHSIAAEAKLQPYTEILAIDHTPVHNWMGIVIHLLSRAGDTNPLQLTVKDLVTHKTDEYTLPLSHWQMDALRPDPLASLGVVPFEPLVPAVIVNIARHSPATRSPLKMGDQVISINNQPIPDWYALTIAINDHPDETLSFVVKRNHHLVTMPVAVSSQRTAFFQKHGFLGLMTDFKWPEILLNHNKYGPITALSYAWQDMMMFTTMNIIVLEKMISGKISLQSLGGPITIFQSAGNALYNGLMSFVTFLAFLSISIGIINIIPIPGLDGGHLLFQTIEAITRRPLSQKVQVLCYRFGMIFLLLIMVQAMVNDILRL